MVGLMKLIAISDALISFFCATAIVGLMLTGAFRDHDHNHRFVVVRGSGNGLIKWVCDEIYVVAEGETLHTISDKCGDPFIVEKNPHIHDPDDVFPGLVIKITPFATY